VVKKKAKRKKKSTAKRTAKVSEGRAKKRVNRARVREDIDHLVWHSAKTIVEKVLEGARGGQVAAARYLFELAGLHPATEEAKARAPEDSLPYMLLRRMGLPTGAVTGEEDSLRGGVTTVDNGLAGEATDTAEADPDRERDEGQDVQLEQPGLEPSDE